MKSPNGGSQVVGNIFLASVAISPTDAWAAGAKPNQSQYLTATLTEHWDGSRWSIVQTPTISAPLVQLNSLAAVDNTEVWAAGYTDNPSCLCGRTVIEHWNGSSWSRVASPNPGIADYLHGIAATSATDLWAIGYQWISQSTWVPLLLHYDGTGWKPLSESQLQFGTLYSVFSLAADDVWAVGTIGAAGSGQGLALHWNGVSWTRESFPSNARGFVVLVSASGVATNDVWAVGNHQFYDFFGNFTENSVSYHWNGSRWNLVEELGGGSGTYSYFTGVKAIATDDVWAVGQLAGVSPPYGPYVTFHWDGSKWSDVANPNQGSLFGISASSSSDVWAVGSGFDTVTATLTGSYTIRYIIP